MDWFNIIKNPELRTGSKITTTLGGDKSNDEDKPCNKKLKEYADKVKNQGGAETVTWRTPNRTIYKDMPVEIQFSKIVDGEYNPVPESVACFALKKLNDLNIKIFDKGYVSREDDSLNYSHDNHLIRLGFNSKHTPMGIVFRMLLEITEYGEQLPIIYIDNEVYISTMPKEQVHGPLINDDDWDYYNDNFDARLLQNHSQELADEYSKKADWR